MIHRINPYKFQPSILLFLIVLLFLAIAGCRKPDTAAIPQDAGSGGQGAVAVPAKPAGTDQSNEDLARIRAIKEQEEARAKASNQSTQEYAEGVRKGAAAPIREIK